MRLRTIGTVVLLATLAGCGPYLRRAKPDEKTFQTNVRCTQGPLVLRTKALGARWGEYLTLRTFAPRALVGRYRVLVDGRVHDSGEFRTSRVLREHDGRTTLLPDKAPENGRCVERPPQVAPEPIEPPPQPQPQPPAWAAQPYPQPMYVPPAQPLPPPAYEASAYPPPGPEWQAMPAPVAAVEPEPDPGWVPPPAPEEPMPVVEVGALVEVAQPSAYPLVHEATITAWRYEHRSLEKPTFPPAGADVAIELWSEQPNDYEGAFFAFEQGAFEPSVPEAEWVAHLEEREAERRRENEEWQREQREKWEREQKERDEQHAWCLAHRDDEDCWGPEGSETAVERARARASAPCPPRPAPQVAAAPQPPPPPQPRPPQEPPPPPKQEVPPRPTPGAEWIPGYWEWTGFEWAWLDGWWKVPEPERRQAIAAAPTPPPAVRVEVRPAPPPVVGVVWRTGEWIWGGRAWIWLPGGWWRAQPRHAPAAPVHRAAPAGHPATPAR